MTNQRVNSIFKNGQQMRLLTSDSFSERIFEKLLEVVGISAATLVQKFKDKMSEFPQKKFKRSVTLFNRMSSGTLIKSGVWAEERCTAEVAEKILELAMFATDPDYRKIKTTKKNNDKTDDYGEMNIHQMKAFVNDLKPRREDVFVDLGSGIGQLVCYVSATTSADMCVGIELEPARAETGKKLLRYFKQLMKYFGKKLGTVVLHHGNVFDEKFCRLLTKKATIGFVNNFSFSPAINDRIERELIMFARNGMRIVSTAPFALGSRRGIVTEANKTKLLAITHQSVLTSLPGGFSWSSNAVSMTMLTVDRNKLKEYEEQTNRAVERKPGGGNDGNMAKLQKTDN